MNHFNVYMYFVILMSQKVNQQFMFTGESYLGVIQKNTNCKGVIMSLFCYYFSKRPIADVNLTLD